MWRTYYISLRDPQKRLKDASETGVCDGPTQHVYDGNDGFSRVEGTEGRRWGQLYQWIHSEKCKAEDQLAGAVKIDEEVAQYLSPVSALNTTR